MAPILAERTLFIQKTDASHSMSTHVLYHALAPWGCSTEEVWRQKLPAERQLTKPPACPKLYSSPKALFLLLYHAER